MNASVYEHPRIAIATLCLLLVIPFTSELAHGQGLSDDELRLLKKDNEELTALCEAGDVAGVEKAMRKYEKLWAEGSLLYYTYATQHGIERLALLAKQGNAEARQLQYDYARTLTLKDPKEKPGSDPTGTELESLMAIQGRLLTHIYSASFPENLKELEEERAERITILLTFWSRVIQVQEEYVEFNMEHPGPNWQTPRFRTPPSFSGTFIFGGAPDHIKDPQVRKDYTEFLERHAVFMAGCLVRSAAERQDEMLTKHASGIFSRLYQGQPDASEIESMMDEIILNPVEAQRLKDAILKDA